MEQFLSPIAQEYIRELKLLQAQKEGEAAETEEYIHVDALASRVAVLYEKIRGVIDYQEEHLLRKNAIRRILERRFFVDEGPVSFAEPFVRELVERGYFPNDAIPIQKIREVADILAKYAYALDAWKNDKKTTHWIFDIASCEVEEALASPLAEETLISYIEAFFAGTIFFKSRVVITNIKDEEKQKLAIFVAVNHSVLRADRARAHWRIFKRAHPQWFTSSTEESLSFIRTLPDIKKEQEAVIHSPLARRLRKVVRQHSAAFLLIHGAATKDLKGFIEMLQNEERFEPYFLALYVERFSILQKKIRRASVRSVISIFLSKMAVAFGAEVPFDTYIVHHFVPQALLFNILFPPLLMFFIVMRIQTPSQKNFVKLLLQISALLKSKEPKRIIVEVPRRRRIASLVYIFYAATFLLSFGAIAYGLVQIGFSYLSIGVFLMFLSLISFSATRINEWTGELQAGEEKEGWGTFLLDLVALPIIRVGKWFSGELQRFNIFVLFLNVLFEAPLQNIVAFLTEWRSFVREKKEEL